MAVMAQRLKVRIVFSATKMQRHDMIDFDRSTYPTCQYAAATQRLALKQATVASLQSMATYALMLDTRNSQR